MVGMRVCKKHRVNSIDVGRQELQSQLRRSVYQQPAIASLEHEPVPRPPVSRIGGVAYGAPTPDDGNAERSTGTEESKVQACPQSVSIRM